MKKKLSILFSLLLSSGCSLDNLYIVFNSMVSSYDQTSAISEISSESSLSSSAISSSNESTSSDDSIIFISINFDTMGAKELIEPIERSEGSEYGDLPVISKDGATFLGWWLTPDWTGLEIKSKTIVQPMTHTLFARWLDFEDALIVESGNSIQQALNQAIPEQVIFIEPGLYQEEIIIDKPLTILGNNYNSPIAHWNLPSSIITPISGEHFNYQGGVISVKIISNNVTIKGLLIDGDNPEYQNIWTLERQQQYINLNSQSVNAKATISYLESYLNNDIGIDGSIGILASREVEAINNLLIENNIVRNYVEYGILINNNLSSSNLDTPYSINVMINDNLLEGIVGLALIGSNNDGLSYAGAYGRAIAFYRGIGGQISNNIIQESTLGIDIYYNFKSNYQIDIFDNHLIDCDSGIWINTTALLQVVTVASNQIELSEKYLTPEYRGSGMSYGIAITGTDNGLLSLLDNNIANYPIGIAAGGTRADTIVIKANTIINCDAAIKIANSIFGYDLKNSSTYLTIHKNNNFIDCQADLDIDELNTNRFAIIKYIENDDIIETVIKGQLLAPTIKLSSDKKKITWGTIVNASCYEVYINDKYYLTQEALSFDIPLDQEDINIYVKAIASEQQLELLDSELSNILHLVRVEKIERLVTAIDNFTSTSNFVFVDPSFTKFADILPVSKSGYQYDGWKNIDGVAIDLDLLVSHSAVCSINWLKNYSIKLYIGTTLIQTLTIGATTIPDLPAILDNQKVISYHTNKNLSDITLYQANAVSANLNLYAKI